MDLFDRLDKIESDLINKMLNELDSEIPHVDSEPNDNTEDSGKIIFNRIADIIKDEKSHFHYNYYPQNQRIIIFTIHFIPSWFINTDEKDKAWNKDYKEKLVITYFKDWDEISIVINGHHFDGIEGIDEDKSRSLFQMAMERLKAYKKRDISYWLKNL